MGRATIYQAKNSFFDDEEELRKLQIANERSEINSTVMVPQVRALAGH
jgi:hypothetical protein